MTLNSWDTECIYKHYGEKFGQIANKMFTLGWQSKPNLPLYNQITFKKNYTLPSELKTLSIIQTGRVKNV